MISALYLLLIRVILSFGFGFVLTVILYGAGFRFARSKICTVCDNLNILFKNPPTGQNFDLSKQIERGYTEIVQAAWNLS